MQYRKWVTEGTKADDIPNRLKNADEETQESMSEHQSALLEMLDDEIDEITKSQKGTASKLVPVVVSISTQSMLCVETLERQTIIH